MPTVDQTITYLEMRSPDELLPGHPPPEPMELERVGPELVELVLETIERVGVPHHWTTPRGRSPRHWRRRLSRPDVLVWLAHVRGEVAGVIELEVHRGGDVEITVFGLVPDFVGKGFGGPLLTEAVRLAWGARVSGRPATTRVWLHTSSLDHPHALGNYQRRGFRVFRSEDRPRPI